MNKMWFLCSAKGINLVIFSHLIATLECENIWWWVVRWPKNWKKLNINKHKRVSFCVEVNMYFNRQGANKGLFKVFGLADELKWFHKIPSLGSRNKVCWWNSCVTFVTLTINMKNIIMFYCTKGHANLTFVEIPWIFKSRH